MKTDEANKIIAEYMGVPPQYVNGTMWNAKTGHTTTKFDDSLDALVPVWRKIHTDSKYKYIMHVCFDDLDTQGCADVFKFNGSNPYKAYDTMCCERSETIQQAAAIATARCIQELD